ncbi:SRPBCC family protein [Nocardia vaccinii]|uniref:SRPBCC family protein n=1 Tax=Nocardia vaccinii TaxID=1822 RepID=UPI001FE1FC7B|nr:SRPBCC family protein [Nocardia vaccinii]
MSAKMLKTTKTVAAVAVGAALLLAGLEAGYRVFVRTRWLTWGASGEEIARVMAGDDLLPVPDILATRAVTILAGPGTIWPWLVQMGPGRAGAYTYDWIENLLGLDEHSSDRITPQFQGLAVGDVLGLASAGPRLQVVALEPERALVLASQDGKRVWSFGLYPTTGGTRLVSRNRIATPRVSWPARMFDLLVTEPGSLIMERKMLLGIKQRAEHSPCSCGVSDG